MAGQLSSVNLIAGAGILANIGGVPISANACALVNISTFDSLAVEVQFAGVKSTANSVLSSSAADSLYNLANDTFPAVTNSIPVSYIGTLGGTPVGGLTSLIGVGIGNIMGDGDIGKFEQILNTSESYVASTNLFINSSINANNLSQNATYLNQDNILTGGLSQVSQAFVSLGEDLLALGTSISLENLPNIGSPEALLKQIYSKTTISPELNTALLNAGISQTVLNNLDNIELTDEQQKIVYDAMTTITGFALKQILRILQVTTTGLTTLADLLNPVKAFPKSFNTLTAPTVNGLRAIYINSSGAVNTNLETQLPPYVLVPLQGARNTYSQLKKIIPADWALANKALQAGLEQIKSIFNTTIGLLGAASLKLESNKGLDLINALTQPLPTNVYDFYTSTYATGSGKNGTLLLSDLVGTAGGWVINTALPETTNVITTLTSTGALNTLTNPTTGVFTVMLNALNGNYYVGNNVVIPGGLPATGTYPDIDTAFTGPGTPGVGLIPAAYSLIGTIVTNNTANVTIANNAWSNVARQLSLQTTNQASAGIVFGNLIANMQPTSLVTSLSSYGLDTSEGGAAWFFESVADTSTIGGQAIVSSMREARNQALLQSAGMQTDIIVDDVIVQTQANNLSSGQYTASEAAGQKII